MDTEGSDPVGFEIKKNDGASFGFEYFRKFETEVKVWSLWTTGIVGLIDEKARGRNSCAAIHKTARVWIFQLTKTVARD
jgi:hypothetical protein